MIATVTARLQALLSEAPKRLVRFSPEEMSKRPAPGKWSKKEIIGHLADSALHNLQRFTYAQLSKGIFSFATYPQDDLVRLNDYQNQPTGQVVALWQSLNNQIVTVLKSLPSEKLSQQIAIPGSEKTVTLSWLIEDYLAHLEHHLAQIFPSETIAPALPENWLWSVEAAKKALANSTHGQRFTTLLEHGKMYLEIYRPEKIDLQKPHDQDEIYAIISGTGTFYNNGERRSFSPGDVIFVPAGIEHRFEGFSEGFSTWVVFF